MGGIFLGLLLVNVLDLRYSLDAQLTTNMFFFTIVAIKHAWLLLAKYQHTLFVFNKYDLVS